MFDLFKEVLETKPQLMECIEKKNWALYLQGSRIANLKQRCFLQLLLSTVSPKTFQVFFLIPSDLISGRFEHSSYDSFLEGEKYYKEISSIYKGLY